MIELQRLLDLPDDLTLTCISTVQGVRGYLRGRPQIEALRTAFESGAITFEEARTFVRDVLAHFAPGSLSPADLVISAVVVAVEFSPAPSIQQFLEELSGVTIAELPFAPRIARLSCRERISRLPQDTVRNFDIAMLVPQLVRPSEEKPVRAEVGTDERMLNLTPAAA